MGGIQLVRKKNRVANQQLTIRNKDGLLYFTAPVFEQEAWLKHGFSSRLGGVSSGDAGTMNLSFSREMAHPERVRENYRRMCAAIGVDPEKLVLTKQTHTNNIRIVTEADAGSGYVRERDYDDVDGLVTNVPGITLVCFSADCVPLLAADPVRHCIGVAHSGWRGTVHDIAGELLSQMHRHYGSEAADIKIAIGPSICQDCYEVGAEVIEHFASAYAPSLHGRLFYRKDNGKYQLDLWEACRQNFLRAGVLHENIFMTDLCTHCNPEYLYSHRTLHGKQGNLGAFLGISTGQEGNQGMDL